MHKQQNQKHAQMFNQNWNYTQHLLYLLNYRENMTARIPQKPKCHEESKARFKLQPTQMVQCSGSHSL